MSSAANPLRGEAELVVAGKLHLLRPTFSALVAAEEELGPLFALVDRAGSGQLRLGEMAGLVWDRLRFPDGLTRGQGGGAVAGASPSPPARPLRALLAQILQGQA